jgi:hypothetical protein
VGKEKAQQVISVSTVEDITWVNQAVDERFCSTLTRAQDLVAGVRGIRLVICRRGKSGQVERVNWELAKWDASRRSANRSDVKGRGRPGGLVTKMLLVVCTPMSHLNTIK